MPGEGPWESIRRRWTIPRYKALLAHFETDGPPLYTMAAQALGWKPTTPATPQTAHPDFRTGEDLAASLSALGGEGTGQRLW